MSRQSIDKDALLFQGKDHWNLNHDPDEREIRTSDGPNGLRIELDSKPGFNPSKPANLFPTASCMACSFDEDLVEEYGRMLGEECREAGVDVLLGPGINHKRSPLCGRNFEYYSEDPLLSGKLGAAYIRGIQSEKVSACLKHLAANSREDTRMCVDSVVDERTLHELYLRAFEIAVKEGKPGAVMPAYNRLNGTHCTENKELMDEVRSWGFDGLFISDWGGVSSPEDALAAGLNIEMPGACGADELLKEKAEKDPAFKEKIHANASRIHAWISYFEGVERKSFDQHKHEEFFRRAAEESAVLLQNNGALPLKKEERIAVIGSFAECALDQGSGSSHVNLTKEECFLDVLSREHITFRYAEGYAVGQNNTDPKKLKEALAAAASCDTIIFFAGQYPGTESEGYDRKTISLPACQTELIEKLAGGSSHLVVVLSCGAPLDTNWRHHADAILCMYFAGMQSAAACMNLLYGQADPCGHLAETWPEYLQDIPCNRWYDNAAKQSQYRETIFSGYRYYTTFQTKTAFPFGYGLSYTAFIYTDLQVERKNNFLSISLLVKNIGGRDGKELIQIYYSIPSTKITRSNCELCGFKKVFVKKGETKKVEMDIPLKCFSYWDVQRHKWMIEEGMYEIAVCRSAEEPVLSKKIRIEGCRSPYTSIEREYFHVSKAGLQVNDSDYACMLGHPVPPELPAFPFTPDTMVYELAECRLGKAVNGVIRFILKGKPLRNINDEMVFHSPMRQALWLNGRISWKTVRLMVDYMNHHRWSTLYKIMRSVQKK